MATESRFVPDIPVAPGETIREILEDRGTPQSDFALRLGKTEKFVSQLINGKAPILPETAIDLERVLGVPAQFWNRAEATYRGLLAEKAQQGRLAEEASWAKGFPLKQMAENRWIARETTPAEQTAEVLAFFGVSSPDAWEEYWASSKRLAARMTKAREPDVMALTAWLRQGEIQAEEIDTSPFDAKRFEHVLQELRAATRLPVAAWRPLLVERCASAGVAVVFVKELPKIRCYGVSRWLSPTKALIQLCLRRKTDDELWFSFYHEAIHLLKHGKKRSFVHDIETDSREEDEASRLAGDILIPRKPYESLRGEGNLSKTRVLRFAEALGVAPSIVVGRLQHDQVVQYSWMNELKTKLEWAE